MQQVTRQDVERIANDLLYFQSSFTTLEVKRVARASRLWATQSEITNLVNQLYDESTDLDRNPSPDRTHQVYTRKHTQAPKQVTSSKQRQYRDYSNITVNTTWTPMSVPVGTWEFWYSTGAIYVDGSETRDAARSTIARYIRSCGYAIKTDQVKCHRVK